MNRAWSNKSLCPTPERMAMSDKTPQPLKGLPEDTVGLLATARKPKTLKEVE